MPRDAIEEAHRTLGVSTVVIPTDHQQAPAPKSPADHAKPPGHTVVGSDRVERVAARLRTAGRSVLLLGDNTPTCTGQRAAGGSPRASRDLVQRDVPGSRRTRQRPARHRPAAVLPTAAAVLRNADAVVVAGAPDPVTYFGYEGIPSVLTPPGSLVRLAGPLEDAEEALLELADLIGGTAPATPRHRRRGARR